MRTSLSVERKLAEELSLYAEKKHGFRRGAVKAELELAIKKQISGGV
jgi:hypothetical protein